MLRNAKLTKNAYVPWYDFIAQQSLLILPLAVPVSLAGMWFFFAAPQARPYRFLGWTYVFLLLEMLVLKARIYYLAPVYPVFFAAGAVWIEQKIAERNWAWAKQAVLIPLTIAGVISASLTIPILPIDWTQRCSNSGIDQLNAERSIGAVLGLEESANATGTGRPRNDQPGPNNCQV